MEIEKDIPIPPQARGKYQFHDMEVGDSRLYLYDGLERRQLYHRLNAASRNYTTRNAPNTKFACRMMDDGIRIWRVK